MAKQKKKLDPKYIKTFNMIDMLDAMMKWQEENGRKYESFKQWCLDKYNVDLNHDVSTSHLFF